MRKIFNDEKQSNVSIKKEKEQISAVINSLKGERELLAVQISDANKILSDVEKEAILKNKKIENSVKTLKLLDVEVVNNERRMSVKRTQFEDLLLEIERLEVEKDKGFKEKEKEMSLAIKSTEDHLLEIELKVKEETEKQNKLLDEQKSIEKNIDVLKFHRMRAEKMSVEMKKEAKRAVEYLDGLEKIVKEMQVDVKKLEDKKQELVKKVDTLTKNVLTETEKLRTIENSMTKRTVILVKKEKEIKVTTELLQKKGIELDKKEKDIMSKAKVLQKHYDKNNIPIKVI